MKVLSSVFWFMLGGAFSSLLFNFRIISPKQNLSTPEGTAIYNLHDDLLPYAIFFIVATGISLILIIGVAVAKKFRRK